MFIKNLALVLFFALSVSCYSGSVKEAEEFHEVTLLGRVSFEVPAISSGFFLEPGPTIIINNKVPISVSVVTQEDIEFVGSNKSPFRFFSNVFSSSPGTVESRFLESVRDFDVKKSHHQGFSVYNLTKNMEQKVYIGSEELDFVVELYCRDIRAVDLMSVVKSLKII